MAHNPRRTTHWPPQLAPIGGIRFARRSSNFQDTVRFYRELVGLPLFETFGESYGSNGAIFGLPSWNLTLEIVESVEPVAVDPHEQLCLYFPDRRAQQEAIARLRAAGHEPVEQHPYWEATGAFTYRDPDGREIVFAPFVFGVNEPSESASSGKHEFPSP
ncbi:MULTISPECIES: VOC family protein [unclassified Mycobacterium]|uniref:VOC family protein n=1 Tax=unclassified Mycobacterium TaxID=2642494 RepID=UPI0007FCF0E0|nr:MULTISPECIES: VOC family protein [unclassified Mycobacterium]OBG61855.1 glyoxalase [Mycobacterium sp. E735]OBG61879.1 glyoxalase [Mycobacterium sp. E188]OBG83035.1 glyoxalase [Mycobacterium sp. E3305]OBH41205.1 glyoxalase [Mycobacterium sp. E183]